MTEPAEGLRMLRELPASQPTPVEELRRRVAGRRRHRRTLHATLAGVAVVLLGAAVVPLVDRPSDAPTRVVAAATGLPEVARTPVGGSTLVLEAGPDCAYLRWLDGESTLAGGCPARQTDHFVETFGAPVPVGDGRAATIVRGGPSMARFSARLADGRTVEGALGPHGWAMVVTDGRMVGVSGFDANGAGVPEWIVR